MKIVKEPTGSITIYPFLSEDAPEQAERGQDCISVFFGGDFAGIKPMISRVTYTVEAASQLAKALIKALEMAGEGKR